MFELPLDIDPSNSNALQRHLLVLEKKYNIKKETVDEKSKKTSELKEITDEIIVPKIIEGFIEGINKFQTVTGKAYDNADFSILLEKDKDLATSFPEWAKEAREALVQAKTEERENVLESLIEKSRKKAEDFLDKKISSKVDFVKAKLKITEEEKKKPFNPEDVKDKATVSGQTESSQSLTKPNETNAEAAMREKKISGSQDVLMNRLMSLRKVQRAITIKRMSGTLGVHNGR